MGCGGSKTEAIVDDNKTAPKQVPKTVKDDPEFTPISDTPRIIKPVYRQRKKKKNAKFEPFREFPTPALLREANARFGELGKELTRDADGNIQPCPHELIKNEFFLLNDYKDIDNHAIQTPAKMIEGTLPAVVAHVTHPAKTQMQGARAIFRWIAAQNLDDVEEITVADSDKEDMAKYWLGRIKSSSWNYGQLFIKMCSLVGIQGQRIQGYVRGVVNQEPDEDVKSYGAIWEVVNLDGDWHFVHTHWGCEGVLGAGPGQWELLEHTDDAEANKGDGQLKKVYTVKNQYFIMDPHEFIYRCFPKKRTEADWQLLARPLKLQEFQDIAHLNRGFFALDLSLINKKKTVIYADLGKTSIEIGKPSDDSCTFDFRYSLWRSLDDGDEQITKDTNKMANYVDLQQVGKSLKCVIDLPNKGKYKLKLSGRKNNVTGFLEIAEYIINSGHSKKVEPHPDKDRDEWGPGNDLQQAGLTPVTHKTGVIEAEDGMAHVKFQITQHVEILHKLHSNTMTAEQLRDYVLQYQHGKTLALDLRVPEKGEYALQLYTKDTNICSYLVRAEDGAEDDTPFPELPGGKAGPTAANAKLGLEPVSHTCPKINSDKTEQVMTFKMNKPLEVDGILHLQLASGPERQPNYVLATTQDDKSVTVRVRLPEKGMYRLAIRAKPKGSEGQMEDVYNYVINSNLSSDQCLPYPQTTPPWRQGCDIKEQLNGVIPSEQSVKFDIKVPSASRVGVMTSNGTVQLEKNKEGFWKGAVDTGKVPRGKDHPSADLSVVAEFTGSVDMKPLLKYKVMSMGDIRSYGWRRREEKRKQREAAMEEIKNKDFNEAKSALLEAMQLKDVEKLTWAIDNAKQKGFGERLAQELQDAVKLKKSIDRRSKFEIAILEMNQKTMMEIKGYRKPPQLVHDVMMAVFLMMGDPEEVTEDWKQCQKRCNTMQLKKNIRDFSLDGVHVEVAARAQEMLQQYALDEVKVTSAGAGTFYCWCMEQISEKRKQDSTNATPAGLERQREIFNYVPPKY